MRKTMKKFVPFLFLLLILPLVFGCTHVREWSLELAISDTKNAETVRAVSQELMNGWPTWSGLLNGLLKERMKDLPMRAIDAWKELDSITCSFAPEKYPSGFCSPPENFSLNDYTLGYYSGTRVRMLFETIVEAIKTYMPDIIGSLPAEMVKLL